MKLKSTNEFEANPLKGNLVFYQNYLPPLESGDYELTVEQAVKSEGKITETTYQNTHHFAVTGPRFTLEPTLISSVYPPVDGSGEYGNVLPHVCFTRDTLPWERSAGHLPSLSSVHDVAPWLAVLLLERNDSADDLTQITLLDLLSVNKKTAAGESGKLPATVFFPPFPGANGNELEFGEKWSDDCLCIDLPLELFNQIAPSFEDLPWLGHVREVQAGAQSGDYLKQLQSMSDELTPPRFSTVLGNRLPAKGSQNQALLISFEQWAPYLPESNGERSTQIPAGIDKVRLVVLAQWSFYAVLGDETFSGYLLNVNKNDAPNQNGFFQLPVTSTGTQADEAINNAFKMGYVPLNHHTRQGDKTVSWYRGPFLPYDEEAVIDIPVLGPDSVTAYNPDTGMFDVSYASAYQLGRLLALQNNKFAETLYNWKRENTQGVISAYEEQIIRESLLEIVQKGQGAASQQANFDADVEKLLNKSLSMILKQFTNLTTPGSHDESN